MGFNGKHLSLEDRKIIEENINKGLRKFETAKELNKSQSTIGKEIKNNRKRRYSQTEDSPWKCKHYKVCKVCIRKCSDKDSQFTRFYKIIKKLHNVKKQFIHTLKWTCLNIGVSPIST